MRAYPVRVPPDNYRGRDTRKVAKRSEYNRVAARVETYLNEKLEKAPDDSIQRYLSAYIARDLREDSELVHRIVYTIDCGSNGVTFYKGNYNKAMNGPTGDQT